MSQQAPADFGRLAASIDHRLEFPIEVRPAELPPLDPGVTLEPIADNHLAAIGADQILGDLCTR